MARLTNREIAKIFENVADLLEIKGENVFRVNSYRNAALTIRDLPRDIYLIYEEGLLTELPDIGKTIANKIEEMLMTGQLAFYDRLTDEVPASLVDILQVNGVGAKKVRRFWQELNITTLTQLEAAAHEGKLRQLSGMGAKSEQKILEGIEALARRTNRVSIGIAYPLAWRMLEELQDLSSMLDGAVVGSLRRWAAIVGNIDLLVAADDFRGVLDAFVNRPDVARVLTHETTTAVIEHVQGIRVDLRVVSPTRYGTELVYYTGSQQHIAHLEALADTRGLSLFELESATEAALYEKLELPWITPELREDRGEIEAAQQGTLPDLISQDDMRGDLHMHTTWSDGKLSIREMALQVRQRGFSHMVISDHSRSLGIANGLSLERLMEQQAEVRAVDDEMGPGFRVLHGTEMEIKADGTLDFPDEVLAKLDIVIASVHVGLRQPREQVTERVLTAIRNPHVDIIGHPSGRLIPDREGADLDMEAVLAAAKTHDTALEINANPRRLDLDDELARQAQTMGVKLAINTDAHRADQLDLLHYGVNTARRGWIEADTVINTWTSERLLAWLESRRQ